MVNRFEHFVITVNDITHALRKLTNDEMTQHGLKSAHALYFTALSNHTVTGLTATQLSDYCGRDKAEVSRTLALLVNRGLIAKEGPTNRYNNVFRLTDAGIAVAQRIQAQASKAVEIAGKDLTDDERRIFYTALDSITHNLQELSEKGIPQ